MCPVYSRNDLTGLFPPRPSPKGRGRKVSSMLIIPAIDLRDGRCVRLAQGRKDATKVYNADPVEVALSFEDDGAEMLHVVDLDGAFSEPNSRNRRALRKILDSVGIPVQFGGGLRTTEDIFDAIDIGLNRV